MGLLALVLGCRSNGGGATAVPRSEPSLAPQTVVVTPTSIPTSKPFVVALSAGHGGPNNVGAVHRDAQGRVDLVEKDLNLDITLRLDKLLRAEGYRTVLIRDGDYSLTSSTGITFAESVREESQARADKANAAGAGVIIAIHFNGSDNSSESGTAVYYDPGRTFGEESRMLATSVYQALIDGFHHLGYDARERGVLNDSMTAGAALAGGGHTFLLGESPGFRATTMAGMIGEALFLTNEQDAELLKRDDARQAIAAAYKTGIDRYVAWRASRGQGTPAG